MLRDCHNGINLRKYMSEHARVRVVVELVSMDRCRDRTAGQNPGQVSNEQLVITKMTVNLFKIASRYCLGKENRKDEVNNRIRSNGFEQGFHVSTHRESKQYRPPSDKPIRVSAHRKLPRRDSFERTHRFMDMVHDKLRNVGGCLNELFPASPPYLFQFRLTQPSFRLVDCSF